MSEASPSLQLLNRTLIGSVLFIDIVDYSMQTVADQLAMKEFFVDLLAAAVQSVAPADRIMVDTGDGAGIAFLGDPEDALFTALSLRDAISASKTALGVPGFVRMGINLGPLKVVRDINGHNNMIGDGVNDAQRVMSFGEPGQVMVSHSYYDIISRLSRDYTHLFVHEGTRHDKHVREHEIYRVGPVGDEQHLADTLRSRSRARHPQDQATDTHRSAAQNMARLRKTSATAIRKTVGSRAGLVATLIGAIAITGAVWSWTSKPEPPRAETAPPAPTDTKPDAAQPVAAESGKALALASNKAEKNMAAAPVSASAPTEKAATPTKPVEKAEKSAASAPPAVKPGTVKLSIQPWGEIYVDGSKRGVSPPLKSLSLAPGKHRIEIRNSQFAPYKQTIEIKSNAEMTVHYVF